MLQLCTGGFGRSHHNENATTTATFDSGLESGVLDLGISLYPARLEELTTFDTLQPSLGRSLDTDRPVPCSTRMIEIPLWRGDAVGSVLAQLSDELGQRALEINVFDPEILGTRCRMNSATSGSPSFAPFGLGLSTPYPLYIAEYARVISTLRKDGTGGADLLGNAFAADAFSAAFHGRSEEYVVTD